MAVSKKNFLNDLDQNGNIMATYIWVGGNQNVRTKTRTIKGTVTDPKQLPIWNYDGSSTNQARGEDSEVMIHPQAIYRDPFNRGDNILVLCDTYTPDGKPLPTNARAPAKVIFDKNLGEKPWYGMEQEYTLKKDGRPLGWPESGYPGPQGPYYCSVGSGVAVGREISEAHYKACLYSGLSISGTNAEVMLGQWEYQIGPVEGIAAGDQLWVSRFLLLRVGEYYGVEVDLDPKPIPGDWNGSGCHVNFSTESMRNDGGYKVIKSSIEKLSKKHAEHIRVYGEGNERRLTGKHETASIKDFSSGVANRGASIRIPRDTAKNGKGYFEDRRPSSNMEPYVVTSKIFKTTIIE